MEIASKRTIWLWVCAFWVLALGTIGLWRGVVLWQERVLLNELGSTLSPVGLTSLVWAFVLCGSSLMVSAIGLWLRQDWARTSIRISVPLQACAFQIYSWFLVRSGLMLERRWIALLSSLTAVLVGTVALTWKRSRAWMGLG